MIVKKIISSTFDKIDTDSLYIGIWEFLQNQGVDKEKWDSLPQDTKINYILRISKVLENHVDDLAYNDTQVIEHNSTVDRDDFSIVFKQEIVCSRILFVKPKKYGYRVVNKEGVPCNKVDVTGLEIIRSETPAIFKKALTNILGRILDGEDDEILHTTINKYKKSMRKVLPEEISSNIGVNNIAKYVKEGVPQKGCPWHVRGAANYHFLLKEFGLENDYDVIHEGNKCKVVYIKKNRFGFNIITYMNWPKEFTEQGIDIDYTKQIEKFFVGKCEILLDPMNRQDILDNSKQIMNLFF